MPYTNRIKARFWAKVAICEHGKECPDCCWPWAFGKTSNGYGLFYLGCEGKRTISATAHRVAWELDHNEFIPNDLWCLHACDNRPCCNPAHLWLGTQQDNMEDMRGKGRDAKGEMHGARTRPGSWPKGKAHWSYTHPELVRKGEQHHSARLTAAQVLEIRALASTGEHSCADLARRSPASRQTIQDIVTGRTWKHLPLGERPRWRSKRGAK